MSSDLAQNEEFLKAAFKGYDSNSDGRVSVKEFKRIMSKQGKCANQIHFNFKQKKTLSLGRNENEIQKMIEKVDVDNDG